MQAESQTRIMQASCAPIIRTDVKNDSIRESFVSPHIIPDEGDETACDTSGLDSFLTRLKALMELTALLLLVSDFHFCYHFQQD